MLQATLRREVSPSGCERRDEKTQRMETGQKQKKKNDTEKLERDVPIQDY
jgi:hypothetical protein